MRDETLLKLSLVIAVIGILGLFLYVQNRGPTMLSVYQMEDMIGGKVMLSGVVNSAYTSKDGHTFLQISDGTGQITVVAFTGSGINADWIKKGESVSVEGRVSEYKGELEIIASNIRPSSQSE